MINKNKEEIRIAIVGANESGKSHVLYDLINILFRNDLIGGAKIKSYSENALEFMNSSEISYLKKGSWITSTAKTSTEIYSFRGNRKKGITKDGCFMNIAGGHFGFSREADWHTVFEWFDTQRKDEDTDWEDLKEGIYSKKMRQKLSNFERSVKISDNKYKISLEDSRSNVLSDDQFAVFLFLYEATDVIFCWNADEKNNRERNPFNENDEVYDAQSVYKNLKETIGRTKNFINVLTKTDVLFQEKFIEKGSGKYDSIKSSVQSSISKIYKRNDGNPAKTYIENITSLYTDFYNIVDENNSSHEIFDRDKYNNYDIYNLTLIHLQNGLVRIDPFDSSPSSERPFKKFYLTVFPYIPDRNKVFDFHNYREEADFDINIILHREGLGIYEILYDIIYCHFPNNFLLKGVLSNNFKRLTGIL